MAAIVGNETTPTIALIFLPSIWSKKVQLATRKAQVLAGTCDMRYEPDMSTGRTLKIQHLLNLSVNTKSDNTVVVPDTNTPAQQSITVSRYIYSSFNVQFQTQVQDAFNYTELMTNQIGYALQGDVEGQLATEPALFTTSTVGTLGQEFTMDDWETIWQKLQTNLTPKDDRWLWLSSAAVSAIRKLGLPINNLYTDSNRNALDAATLSDFMGFTPVESQYLVASGGGHQCSAQHRNAVILIRQQLPQVEKDRIIGDLSELVVGWMLYTQVAANIVAEAAGSETSGTYWSVYCKTV